MPCRDHAESQALTETWVLVPFKRLRKVDNNAYLYKRYLFRTIINKHPYSAPQTYTEALVLFEHILEESNTETFDGGDDGATAHPPGPRSTE